MSQGSPPARSGSCAVYFLLLVLAALPPVARGVTLADFAARTYTNPEGAKLPYRLFIPPNYNAGEKYPLVLFLHGSDDRGSDNRSQFNNTGVWSFLSNDNQVKHPCFLAAPQCPAFSNWERPITRQQLLSLLNSLQSEFSIDPDRWYVTGLSMGGSGTWSLVTRNPSLFAAAVPMNGIGVYYPTDLITELAVWNFHAANDDVVNVSYSDYIIAALRAAGGTPLYTRYDRGGHAIWSVAYRTPGLVDWVMAQRRGLAPAQPPDLQITIANSQRKFLTTETAIGLAGTAAGVTELIWTNHVNNATGTISAPSGFDWFTQNIPLRTSAQNLITIQGRGPSGSSSYGGYTTINARLHVAVEQPIAVATESSPAGLMIRWSGGAPPYSVQEISDLRSDNWSMVRTNVDVATTLPISGRAAFFRVLGSSTIPRLATVDDFVAKVLTENGAPSLPYRLFVPSGYDPARKYPIVLFLHAYAEAGTDNRAQLTHQTSPLIFVSPDNQKKYPCFMVAPQCPESADWNDATRRRQLRALLGRVQSEFSIDADRVYITGFSFGAVGVWDAITQNPNLFAAAVPISSYWSGSVNQIAELPLWIFQSADDLVAGILDTEQLVAELRNAGGRPIFTRYEQGGHGVWPSAYKTPGLVDWVMAQKRGNPSRVTGGATLE